MASSTRILVRLLNFVSKEVTSISTTFPFFNFMFSLLYHTPSRLSHISWKYLLTRSWSFFFFFNYLPSFWNLFQFSQAMLELSYAIDLAAQNRHEGESRTRKTLFYKIPLWFSNKGKGKHLLVGVTCHCCGLRSEESVRGEFLIVPKLLFIYYNSPLDPFYF